MPDNNLKDKPDSYWRSKLTAEQYQALREKGTEMPFTGKYVNNHATGMYHCAACGQELFSSTTKFDSRSGWPSFSDPVNRRHVELNDDHSHGMIRTEVTCSSCGAHLGHLFPDGPKDLGGMRYCINSVCLDFKASDKLAGK